MSLHKVTVGESHLRPYSEKPAIDALAELIWNSLDAEADQVEVKLERESLGKDSPEFISHLSIFDNGHGIDPEMAVEQFTQLGDSWKQGLSGLTVNSKRVLHGNLGRGRFLAYSLGDQVTWCTIWEDINGKKCKYQISGSKSSMNEFEISESHESNDQTGTFVKIRGEQGNPLSDLLDDELNTRLCARFASHLLGNIDINIYVDEERLDVAHLIENRLEDENIEIDKNDLAGHPPPILRIIEWNQHVRGEMPTLILCNAGGISLIELDKKKISNQPVRVTGYLLWEGFESVSEDLLITRMTNAPIIEIARERINEYVSKRTEELRKSIVEQLQEEGLYPYPNTPPDDNIMKAEQQLYDVVLVAARSALGRTRQNRQMVARLMKIAIQQRTAGINDLMNEVLNLPPEIREMLRDLLQDTSLADIVKAGNEVRTRIELLCGLRRVLYGPDTSPHMREVDQLHPLVRGNEWLFGEEWLFARSESSLTTVLRDVVPDTVLLEEELLESGGQVLQSDGRRGRIDLLFQRLSRGPSGKSERLIVELKRPSIKLGPSELEQVRKYARALERHQGVAGGHWTFWLVGTQINEDLHQDLDQTDRDWGHVDKRSNCDIHVTRWSDLIEDAERRLEFFRRQLDLEIGQDQAALRLHSKHQHLIPRIGNLADPD